MLRPPPQLTVSQWAEQHRVLSTRASSEPGPWRTSRTPYLRDIMDALSAVHPARRVVFMKGAQVGASEGGNCWLGYIMHHVPAPVLAVQPTVELAKRFSRQRIDPLLEETPALRERVAPARARDSGNTMLSKEFPGGILVLTGANSAVGLRSMTARFLFLDEVDAYPGDVEGEGDPIALAEARARTFGWRRKAYLVSTPTLAGRSRIEREYQMSDQRRFFVPCPSCQAMQWLRFERLIWEKGNPASVTYHCEGCDAAIGEHHKTAMLAGGEWQATAISLDPHTIGFHISALYSPVGWLSWEQIARDWEAAQGKPADLKTFRNTVLGEVWQEHGEAPDWERLVERREDFFPGTVPAGVLVLTAGVDVQDDRIECDVWGWAEGFTSWLIDHVVIPGSPRERAPWEALAKLLARDWPRPAGGAIRIAKLCVDTGGRDTASVYGHLRHLRDPRVAPTKGVEGWNRAQPVQGPTLVDALVNGQKLRRGLKLWTVSVSTWKADLYRRLWLGRGESDAFPQGWVHLPRGIEVEWVKQLVAEQLRTVKDRRGFTRQEWAKLRERNEALDCAVLARAARVVTAFLDGARPQVWVADRYGGQLGHGAVRQVCLAHLLRDANYAIDEGCTTFAPGFKWLLLHAMAIGRRRPDLKDSTLRHYHGDLERRLDRLLTCQPDKPASRRLFKAMRRDRDDLFRFVIRRDVPTTNNACERALRPAVIFRKVTGGFRAEWGAKVYAAAATVIATGRLHRLTALAAIREALAGKPIIRDG